MTRLRVTIRKAALAAVGTGLTAGGVALSDGSLTGPEALIVLSGVCATAGGVWKVSYQVPIQGVSAEQG